MGDALGFPVQFLDRETVQQHPVRGMSRECDVRWSDDTSLSLCLADSLRFGYNLQDIADKFVRWMDDGLWTPHGAAFDIGATTGRAIANLRYGVPPLLAGLDHEYNNGNGSLMRILPLVPYIMDMDDEERFRIVSEVSSLTHRHPRGILACIALCEFAIDLVRTRSLPDAWQSMQQVIHYLSRREKFIEEEEYFTRLLQPLECFRSIEEKDIRSSGYVIDTLEASLWSLFNADNFRDTLLLAVNLGHDADTVGAITGALAALVHGHASIPPEWLHAISCFEDISRLADELDGKMQSCHPE